MGRVYITSAGWVSTYPSTAQPVRPIRLPAIAIANNICLVIVDDFNIHVWSNNVPWQKNQEEGHLLALKINKISTWHDYGISFVLGG